jgi:hypothetical protein
MLEVVNLKVDRNVSESGARRVMRILSMLPSCSTRPRNLRKEPGCSRIARRCVQVPRRAFSSSQHVEPTLRLVLEFTQGGDWIDKDALTGRKMPTMRRPNAPPFGQITGRSP